MNSGRALVKTLFWIACWCAFAVITTGQAVRAQDVPRYKVDPSWPRQLPNNWITGGIGGINVDKDDHIWVVHRALSISKEEVGAAQKPPLYPECCFAAPAVLEFDQEGNLLKAWGGPGWVPDWPYEEHSIYVDREENVWLGGNGPLGRGAPDRQILKFTNDGKKLLMELGYPSMDAEDNQNTTLLGGPAGLVVDDAAHEVFIADGYVNKRVVVYDSDTGKFKRGWGAYGVPLSEIDNGPTPPYDPMQPSKEFVGPVHCIHISVDNLVYVCDREGDRLQVFTKQGKFVQEIMAARETHVLGSLCGMAFSHDPKQKYIFVAGCGNNVIWIMDRHDGKVVDTIGQSGGNMGEFSNIHVMIVDSHGNLYTGETGNKRVQRFVLQNGNANP